MTNSKILFDNLIRNLKLHDSEDEVQAIAFEVLNHFGISRTDVLAQKNSSIEYNDLLPIVDRLNNHEPIQYILGEAWFCGHQFLVNQSVLIPRPETEHLVEEALKSFDDQSSLSILDIGTGSGCIAITLSLMFPNANVEAIDVSLDALAIAQENATRLQSNVQFKVMDILNEQLSKKYDLIVSNPPYIADEEKASIARNVKDYEPHIALFAHPTDPLIFYTRIAELAKESLNMSGKVILEINERFGSEIECIFLDAGFVEVCIIKDLAKKDRAIIVGL